jgi:hypothetical protein
MTIHYFRSAIRGAGNDFENRPVANGDHPPSVADCRMPLKSMQRISDRRSPNAQNVAQVAVEQRQ